MRGNPGMMLDHMDVGLQKKLQSAMEAAAIAQKRGLFVNEALQFIADYLASHPDPDIRDYQAKWDQHHRRDLN